MAAEGHGRVDGALGDGVHGVRGEAAAGQGQVVGGRGVEQVVGVGGGLRQGCVAGQQGGAWGTPAQGGDGDGGVAGDLDAAQGLEVGQAVGLDRPGDALQLRAVVAAHGGDGAVRGDGGGGDGVVRAAGLAVIAHLVGGGGDGVHGVELRADGVEELVEGDVHQGVAGEMGHLHAHVHGVDAAVGVEGGAVDGLALQAREEVLVGGHALLVRVGTGAEGDLIEALIIEVLQVIEGILDALGLQHRAVDQEGRLVRGAQHAAVVGEHQHEVAVLLVVLEGRRGAQVGGVRHEAGEAAVGHRRVYGGDGIHGLHIVAVGGGQALALDRRGIGGVVRLGHGHGQADAAEGRAAAVAGGGVALDIAAVHAEVGGLLAGGGGDGVDLAGVARADDVAVEHRVGDVHHGVAVEGRAGLGRVGGGQLGQLGVRDLEGLGLDGVSLGVLVDVDEVGRLAQLEFDLRGRGLDGLDGRGFLGPGRHERAQRQGHGQDQGQFAIFGHG